MGLKSNAPWLQFLPLFLYFNSQIFHHFIIPISHSLFFSLR
jgi:hypothetical protein